MDHRPFEDWLLADEPLTPRQKRELQAHLRTCNTCAALAEVDLALNSVKAAAPAEGFTARFHVRLAAQKKALRMRNLWGFLLLSLSVVSIALWLSWPVLKAVLRSPVNLLASWLSYLVSLWASLQAMGSISSVLLRIGPGFIPAYVWLAVLLAGGGWSLLWIFSLKKFAKYPRGV
jgi:hypothetical protein